MKKIRWMLCFTAVLALTVLAAAVSAADLTGEGTKDKPYEISTREQLIAFRNIVNGDNPAACAKLMNDINLGGGPDNQCTPIGSEDNIYTGTFDGNGKTISHFYISGSESNQGFFGYVGGGAVIKNLTVEGEVAGDDYLGGIISRIKCTNNDASVTVSNCTSDI